MVNLVFWWIPLVHTQHKSLGEWLAVHLAALAFIAIAATAVVLAINPSQEALAILLPLATFYGALSTAHYFNERRGAAPGIGCLDDPPQYKSPLW
jgi:hypothetical protein